MELIKLQLQEFFTIDLKWNLKLSLRKQTKFLFYNKNNIIKKISFAVQQNEDEILDDKPSPATQVKQKIREFKKA